MRSFFQTLSFSIVTLAVLALPLQSANALIHMDAEGINLSIKYGIRYGSDGLYHLLGPNWIEGRDGALLNIYSPFMLLASRVGRGGYSGSPTADELKAIRKRYHKTIRMFKDQRHPAEVKFALSFMGSSEDFARDYTAHIEGVGRGQKFRLKPMKTIPQKYAKAVTSREGTIYEAINSYYFKFDDLKHTDDFVLTVENRQGEQFRFKVDTNQIY